MCDLEKAFYCFNHGTVVHTLEFSGISGKFQTAIPSYLRVRFQSVIIGTISVHDGFFSRCTISINGVPRRFQLDPLFLLTYIIDVPKITHNNAKVVPFADDN